MPKTKKNQHARFQGTPIERLKRLQAKEEDILAQVIDVQQQIYEMETQYLEVSVALFDLLLLFL
jgi:hypothetical protein